MQHDPALRAVSIPPDDPPARSGANREVPGETYLIAQSLLISVSTIARICGGTLAIMSLRLGLSAANICLAAS